MSPVFTALYLFAAAAAAASSVPPVVAVTPKPAPLTLGATFGASAFGVPLRPLQGFTPLQGLAAVGDPAPQCRNTCTKNHAICGDDAECGEQWRQCVAGCASAAR